MTKDILAVRKGIEQAKAALELLEKFVTEYEGRTVNILPREDVAFYRMEDDAVIAGEGFGDTDSLNRAIRQCAEKMAAIERA